MAGTEGNKRIKSGKEEKEDRISSLPDFLIQHILSLLPATDLPKTSVLSKWWNNQWTHVSVLKFVPKARMSPDKFFEFIDKTLMIHDCSNLHKFKIKIRLSAMHHYPFPSLGLWIHFAMRKHVKEINLNMRRYTTYFSLPRFIFDNSSLVKLKLSGFIFMQFQKVNWESVKSLSLDYCKVDGRKIANVLSGSPLLEYLRLRDCDMMEFKLVIASKRLKTLILAEIGFHCSGIDISCPNLVRLRVSGWFNFTSLKLTNLPSSVHATLDFLGDEHNMSHDGCINLVQQTLRQVQHVEKLEVNGASDVGDLIWKDQAKNVLSNEVRM